jgi:hypothetical protein
MHELTRRTMLVSLATMLGVLLAPKLALAQMMGGQCQMGTGMWLTMLLGVLLIAAAIVALAALAVFLIRRSRPPHGPHAA